MGERAVIAEGLVEKVVGLLVGLGQETRLRILEQLADGGTLTPNELAERLGLTQQNVSKHLKTLAQAGIVVRSRDGSSALYRIKDPSILVIVDDVVALVVREVREMSSHAGVAPEDGGDERSSTG